MPDGVAEPASPNAATVAAEAGGPAIVWPALLAVLFWSGVSPFAKYALDEMPALAYTALRPLIAVVLLFAVLLVRRDAIGMERGDLRRMALAGTFGMGLSQLCFIGGLARTSVAHAVILISCSPLLVAGYRWLIRRQRLDPRSVAGVLGGFAGVILLVSGAGGEGGASLIGDLLCLGAAITWIGATVWPQPLVAKYGTLRSSAWLLATSIPITLSISLGAIAETFADPPSALAWASVFYGAIFGVLLANTLWQHAVHTSGAARTLVYLYLEPVGALLLAALFLGERLSAVQAVGGVLALAGVALVRRG